MSSINFTMVAQELKSFYDDVPMWDAEVKRAIKTLARDHSKLTETLHPFERLFDTLLSTGQGGLCSKVNREFTRELGLMPKLLALHVAYFKARICLSLEKPDAPQAIEFAIRIANELREACFMAPEKSLTIFDECMPLHVFESLAQRAYEELTPEGRSQALAKLETNAQHLTPAVEAGPYLQRNFFPTLPRTLSDFGIQHPGAEASEPMDVDRNTTPFLFRLLEQSKGKFSLLFDWRATKIPQLARERQITLAEATKIIDIELDQAAWKQEENPNQGPCCIS